MMQDIRISMSNTSIVAYIKKCLKPYKRILHSAAVSNFKTIYPHIESSPSEKRDSSHSASHSRLKLALPAAILGQTFNRGSPLVPFSVTSRDTTALSVLQGRLITKVVYHDAKLIDDPEIITPLLGSGLTGLSRGKLRHKFDLSVVYASQSLSMNPSALIPGI